MNIEEGLNEGDSRPSAPQGSKLKSKTYTNVVDMVRDITDDDKFADDLQKSIDERQIINMLVVARIKANKSMGHIAVALDSTIKKVNDLECAGVDMDVAYKHMKAYADVCGCDLLISLQGRASSGTGKPIWT